MHGKVRGENLSKSGYVYEKDLVTKLIHVCFPALTLLLTLVIFDCCFVLLRTYFNWHEKYAINYLINYINYLKKLLDIVFPAAVVMCDIAKSQDAEVGDGTTSGE